MRVKVANSSRKSGNEPQIFQQKRVELNFLIEKWDNKPALS